MLRVKPLKIKLSTNMNTDVFDLTFSKIYDPAPGERSRKILISEYPFFTADVKYDETFLQTKPYYEILSIFFDKKEFVKAITKNTSESINPSTDPAKLMQNANENVMIMLRLLFPISYPTKNNLNTSYRKYFLNQPPAISLESIDVTSMFSSGEITPMGKRTYSYLKMQSGICTVSEVIWLNDLLNNKLYRELIDKIIEYTSWKDNQTIVIDEDIKKISDQLLNGLTASGSGSGSGNSELLITSDDRDELANQKRIYNPDDIKKDMMDIIKKYVTIDADPDKSKKFDEELGFMVDYFIDTNIKGSSANPITQIVRFKDKFDFTYTNPQGKSDLFTLHKRYNGEDKKAKQDDLNSVLPNKQEEIEKLTNGYLTERSTEFVFGKTQLTDYINNLKDAMDYINSNPPTRGRFLENNGHITKEYASELQNFLKKSIPLIQHNVNRVKVTDAESYSIEVFGNVGAGKGPSAILDDFNKRYNTLTQYLKTINEKIQKLTAEIDAIDAQVKELNQANPNIFLFKDEPEVPLETIAQLKKDNGPTITKMQEEIFKKVITRYNRFQDIRRSAELSGQYTEIDSDIDIIVDELVKLEEAVKSSTANNPLPPKTILDITSPIKRSFDKLVAGNKISISRTIGDKLTKIINLSNQIQFLTQLQSIFFKPTATGIFVDYEKSLDPNDSFTKMIITELNQQKYANFKKMIDYIRERFLKNEVVSLNDELTKVMAKYFKNESNDFYDSVVKPADELINSGKKQDFESLKKLWDVSVTSIKSAELENEYEISVYMELIEGELNSKNQSGIKCQYLNDELIRRFEDLMDEEPSYGPPVNPQAFSIAKANEEVIKHKQEQKEQLESALNSIAKKTNDNPIQQGGKRLTKSYRSSKKNCEVFRSPLGRRRNTRKLQTK